MWQNHRALTAPLDVVFIFAHQDDEVGALPRIERELAAGKRVHCFYLTSGNGKGCSPAVRDAETRNVLLRTGIRDSDIHFLGSTNDVADGQLMHRLDLALSLMLAATRPMHIARIYTLAWEGGHADHDAAHLVASALARRLAPAEGLWEFSMYNGKGVPWRFFRTMRLLPTGAELERDRLTLREGIRYARACLAYPSQRKTWLGLFWETLIRRAVLREMVVQRVDPRRLAAPPHPGRLLYERMFGVRYEDFRSATAAFVERELATLQ